MNDQLKQFARQTLKDGLAQCTEKQQAVFRLMYSEPTDPRDRNPEVVARIKAADIEDVVDNMPAEKLDWAMDQMQTTLNKAGRDGHDGR